ncbi:MAG: YbhB/YbcL family Raf kinase inhibitor-like protein [Desulfosarcinaceae bacterium]|jgi:Raf kinase inhibitor-like YbhB/YbcL family protein
MQLTSPAFGPNGTIPRTYTCQGADVSPELSIAAVPGEAESLVLILADPDAAGGRFDHWIVYNIPATITRIEKGTSPGALCLNDFGKTGYGGPCPPSGTHRYVFTLYALDCMLSLPTRVDRKELFDAMKGHVLTHAELIGHYGKS